MEFVQINRHLFPMGFYWYWNFNWFIQYCVQQSCIEWQNEWIHIYMKNVLELSSLSQHAFWLCCQHNVHIYLSHSFTCTFSISHSLSRLNYNLCVQYFVLLCYALRAFIHSFSKQKHRFCVCVCSPQYTADVFQYMHETDVSQQLSTFNTRNSVPRITQNKLNKEYIFSLFTIKISISKY